MPSSPEPLRIVIVDDHPVVRQGLVALIDQQPDMIVCGESDTVAGALARIASARPAVAVIDMSLGLESGLQVVKALDASASEVRVLMLSMHDETLYAERALAAGARGYIMKQEAMGNLIDAIRCVASGRTYVSPAMSDRIIARATARGAARTEREPLDRLTDREREVLTLRGQGLGTGDIAERLGLSVKTVETYYSRIKEKLGLHSASELIRTAVTWTDQ